MQLIEGEEAPADARGGVVAVGNFDGVHRGHQALIGEARRLARARGVPLQALTFEPHPRTLFRPEGPPFRLTPAGPKARLLEGLGVDALFVQRFDAAFAALTAQAFMEDVLVGRLGTVHVVVGEDFLFGHARAGHAETLAAYGKQVGFGVTPFPPVADEGGEVYSSTRVRNHLVHAAPGRAAALLGRPWEIEGPVLGGDQRGRTIGFPTANMALGAYLRPAFGIYAVRVVTPDGTAFGGVANLGIRPMWRTEEPLLETHLFDFSGDLYGQVLRVQLVDYLRPEAKFDGVDALVAQMDKDAQAARQALSPLPRGQG